MINRFLKKPHTSNIPPLQLDQQIQSCLKKYKKNRTQMIIRKSQTLSIVLI